MRFVFSVMINFKANFVNSATIQKQDYKHNPEDYKVSFVEMHPADTGDYLALNQTNLNWDNCNTLAHDITRTFNKYHDDKTNTHSNEHFFAITRQTDNFEHLEPQNILSVIELKEKKDKSAFVEYLQVSPRFNHSARKSHFRKIGTAMLDSIKLLISSKKIELSALNSAIDFYLKNGFQIVKKGQEETIMRWCKK
jgi:hypothetical protein